MSDTTQPESAAAGAKATSAPSPLAGETATGDSPDVAGAPSARPNRRKVRDGLVVSASMQNTVVVAIIERVRHPRYAKTVQRTKKLYADDPSNELRVGDRVRLQETRPLSKLKRWRVVEVLERAK